MIPKRNQSRYLFHDSSFMNANGRGTLRTLREWTQAATTTKTFVPRSPRRALLSCFPTPTAFTVSHMCCPQAYSFSSLPTGDCTRDAIPLATSHATSVTSPDLGGLS
ncbi:hypothetical protein KC19_4G215200 [Ceratodon purpureus]|uniref:Uncharacterized protein n=1 Tax=Ceratodon purpureus TaxID=3225 RepID=A0A8T0IB74_CERPU|nr:hypothetical protein KC19_4G215200 [Ceratodon purpureus]